MGGSARTPTLTALLCLGLCRGLWDQAQTGTLPKPSIWADPSPMVTKGSRVTLWCQASLQADDYYLYKDRAFVPSETLETSWDSSNKTSFSIIPMSLQYIGRYQCAYQSGESRSQLSDPLTLVMTGQGDAPSLLANPGPVVALGGNVSLSCSSSWPRGSFHLLKERGADAPQHLEWTSRPERGQGLFHMGPVNTSHAGTYRCYVSHQSYPNWWSQPSDPLHLQVTGVYRAPSLLAQPGSLVQSGDSLTLQCRSETGFDRFALTKDKELRAPQRLEGQPSPDFPLGPVSNTHGGWYQCYCGHKLSSTWSEPSAPLRVLITGIYAKPSLSAQPGASVSWGENVTLQCHSEIWFDTFHLSKEGSLAPPRVLHLQDTAIPYQVNFILSPATSDLEGTYRCYGSHSNSPYLLSQPSDPLELVVSGGSEHAALNPQRGSHLYLYILIAASVAFILVLGLLVFLLVRHRRQVKGRKPAAAASEDRGLHRSSGPEAAAQEETFWEPPDESNVYAALAIH
ncbi:leukocyte immunoglobulin-like receptor subfamily B member 3 isoform X3 [Meles meles]|uniref:leukocyte immunoglobulin-like receptor subfamily B member 3 isoform X3 n=1 Tax=Meles meles TaxID=9662 RepID=UPI001E69E8D1|nr:leukocyte immunoglobulin-like receptor subfamily B member 3 isoform X3 [Meles meles]